MDISAALDEALSLECVIGASEDSDRETELAIFIVSNW